MTENILIEASAGTGKTFSLATRFIRLLAETSAHGGAVKPEQIIALTFSRAATREIYSKLAQRLADAAADDKGAAKESAHIGKNLTKEDFGKILATVIASQHIGTISTIDSFILRMIRYFPLELGFQGNVQILSDFDSKAETREACRSFLSSSNVAQEFINTFRETIEGKSKRAFASALDNYISHWRDFILDNPKAKSWTFKTMLAAMGIDASKIRTVKSKEDLAVFSVASEDEKKTLDNFLAFFGGYNGGVSPIPKKGIESAIVKAFIGGEHLGSVKFNRSQISFSAPVAEALRTDLTSAFTLYIVIKLRQMAGILKLVAQIDAKYDETTRSRGRLTFGDLPRAIASHSEFDIENLQYRFDEQLDHWAIDEFQDTSRAQWNCLHDLVDNAATGDGGRTVTIVGDLKQAIYAWRGGDESIFSELAARKDFNHQQLAASYRYGRNTADILNRVFGEANLRNQDLPLQCQDAIGEWLDNNSWMEHTIPKDHDQKDYVCVLGTTGGREAVIDKTVDLVLSLWTRRKENGLKNKTIAVLVRSNEKGRELADSLRAKGVDAVFEGENTDANHPVVAAFLNLLHFADHPGDTYDREVIFGTPLARLFAPDVTSVKDASLLSAIVSKDISHLGLVRALRKYIGMCQNGEYGLDEYSRQALNRLVQAASNYDARGESTGGVDGFIDFFRAMTTRDMSNPAIVTVMTVHRSKGLGFDWVIVPIMEHASVEKPDPSDPLCGTDWVLPYISSDVCAVFPNLNRAYDIACNKTFLANLHTYYVALSRNKEGLWVVTEYKNRSDNTIYFRDILFSGLGISPGADVSQPLYESQEGGDPSMTVCQADGESHVKPASSPFNCAPSTGVAKRMTPSSAFLHGGKSIAAASIFDSTFGAAAARGTDIHSVLSRIEWLDDATGQPEGIKKEEIDLTVESPFRSALASKEGVIDLWREKSFELLDGEDWISGTFDRVVFREKDGEKSAEIYDFKTNAIRKGETEEAFAARMAEDYLGQMSVYRLAVHKLTAIPVNRITCTLLLTATKAALPVVAG